jgi:hypothetical protein
MRCPFCDSAEVELVSAWGAQIITSQVRCRRCGTYFEALRSDFDPTIDTGPPGRPPGPRGPAGPVAETDRDPA